MGLSSILPFYKYIMESYNLNIFFGVGLISLAYLPILLKCKILDEENAETKSAKFFAKGSNISPIKNSDAIMEATYKKSSMIA